MRDNSENTSIKYVYSKNIVSKLVFPHFAFEDGENDRIFIEIVKKQPRN